MSTSTAPTPPPPAPGRSRGTSAAGPRIARAVAALCVAVAAAVGVAAPAQAAPLGVVTIRDFQVQRVGNGQCKAITNGAVQLESQAAAQNLVGRVVFSVKLRGDDPVNDDDLYSVGVAQNFVTPYAEIFFYSEVVLRCGILDEDDSFYDDNDEVYARVDYHAFRYVQTKNSRVWHDSF